MNKHLISCLISTALVVILGTANNRVSAQEFTDFSVLPETVSTPPNLIPNILIVLDNSATMRISTNPGGRLVGSDNPQSRSYIARQILRDIISDPDNRGRMNVGFMEFDLEWNRLTGRANTVSVEDCGDRFPPEFQVDPADSARTLPATGHTKTPILAGCDTSDNVFHNLWEATAQNTARGRLRENVSLLDDEKVERMIKILGIEPQLPDIRCTRQRDQLDSGRCAGDFFDADDPSHFNPTTSSDEDDRITEPSYIGRYTFRRQFIDPSDGDGNGVPDMVEDPDAPSFTTFGTPTFGSLVSAQNYLRGALVGTDVRPMNNGFLATLLANGVTPTSPLASSGTGLDLSCSPKNFILLITDGAPQMNLFGEVLGNSGTAIESCRSDDSTLQGGGSVDIDYSCSIASTDSPVLRHTKASIAPLVAAMRAGFKVNVSEDSAGGAGYSKSLNDDFAPIETLVFGFGLNATTSVIADEIANAGSFLPNPDGSPSTTPRDAFLADDAETLRTQLQSVFAEITPAAGSGSGVSIVSSSNDATGSVVQAIYNPQIVGQQLDLSTPDPTDTIDGSVYWTGTLSAFFLDRFGFLREDDGDAILEDYVTDPAFFFDFVDLTPGDPTDNAEQAVVQRLTITDIGTPTFSATNNGPAFPISELNPIWEASDVLGGFPQTTGTGTSTVNIYSERNRPYKQPASVANGVRRIYSWIQNTPGDGNFNSGTQIDFTYNNTGRNDFDSSNFSLLGVDTEPEAENIIRFIRGEEGIPGFRSRSIQDSTNPLITRRLLLGDIVHSTAAQVDAPDGDFDTQFGDTSYTAFRDEYQNRRRMVYVGANDGLLHAFNGGFYDDGDDTSTPPTLPRFELTSSDDNVSHALGAEVWAYAPMNLLPHLQFLTRSDYTSSFHVAYMDAPVKTFDVRAFTPDATHINGWGTILVAGMRLGGGEFDNVDPDGSGTGAAFTARSAYVIIDITDPSEEPVVIGEITHPDLGFTTSEPTVMKEGDDWYLVFGSGPTEINTVTSTQRARLFRYKLNETGSGARSFDTNFDGSSAFGDPGSFVGSLIAQDWDNDFNDDAVYFGTISGTEQNTDGKIYRFVSGAEDGINANGEIRALLDTGQPVVSQPRFATSSGQNFVYFGTGRFFTNTDSENTQQNTFYGVKEPINSSTGERDYSTASTSDIVDVTGIRVAPSSTAPGAPPGGSLVTAAGTTTTVDGAGNVTELRALIAGDTSDGWKSDLPRPPAAGFGTRPPSAKNTTSGVIFRDLLSYTFFEPPIPDDNQCTDELGVSFLRIVDLSTGVAFFSPDFDGPLGLDGNGNIEDTFRIGVGANVQLDAVVSDDPTGQRPASINLCASQSTGVFVCKKADLPPGRGGRTSWQELEIQ